jgi:hypothetical protein
LNLRADFTAINRTHPSPALEKENQGPEENPPRRSQEEELSWKLLKKIRPRRNKIQPMFTPLFLADVHPGAETKSMFMSLII